MSISLSFSTLVADLLLNQSQTQSADLLATCFIKVNGVKLMGGAMIPSQ